MERYENLTFEVRGSVARITLNRPEASNASNLETNRELLQVVLRCDEDPLVRAVLVTGAGRNFCAGGDLKRFVAEGKDLPRYLKEATTYRHAAVSRLANMDAPVVAAVQGSTIGGGLGLVCSCDIVLAAESARFRVGFTGVGMSPDGGLSYFLPRIVGLRRALELMLTNRVLSAQEALALGIVTRVVPEVDLLREAEDLATELAAGATRALGAAKRLFRSGWNETLETQMGMETQAIAEMARTRDSHEAFAAFVEKRTAQFRGE
jgi:2-(1,2-epoxy-1,2-dihydrophenyl)acetyl-CoA isomerase